MKVLVLYDSMGGNTEKIAQKIDETVEAFGISSTLLKVSGDLKLNFYDYDLVFVGSPVIEWLPTPNMMSFIKSKMMEHRLNGNILPCSPFLPGKYAVCFGTFCGAHIGLEEALPMTQWLAAFLGHIGYKVLDQINVPSEIRDFGQNKGWMNANRLEKLNTVGRCGNIKGKPDLDDLKAVETKIKAILSSLKFVDEIKSIV